MISLLILFNLLALLQLASAIYTFSSVKSSPYDKPDDDYTDYTKKISLSLIIVLPIIILLANIFYFRGQVNSKRTILNLALLTVITSIFLYVNFAYFELQKKSHPGYSASHQALVNNSDNTNKTLREYTIIVSIITSILPVILISFFIGYTFFPKVEIKREEKPVLVEKKTFKRNKLAKLNLF